jgi:hypothetical protein
MNLRSYIVNIVLSIAYTLIYAWCYTSFLAANFAYAGVDLYPRDGLFLASSVAIAVLPILCYRGVRALSSVLSAMVYLVLYVPIIITFAFGSAKPLNEIMVVELTFLFGMVLLFLADVIVVRSPVDLDVGVDLMPVVLTVTTILTVYTFIVYRGNLHFSDFGEAVYEQRFANVELGADLATRYLLSWLSTVLIPLCFAHGLVARRSAYLIAGTTASVLLYMGAANKITILLPVVFVGFYVLLRTRIQQFFPLMAGGLAATIGGLMALSKLPSTILFFATTLLLSRTIGNGGTLAVRYQEFFSSHPQTGYAHINGLKLLLPPNPYGDLIPGQVIGEFYYSANTTANASFWATDGLAAMGLLGVVLASMACAVVFGAMNTITRRHNPLFVVMCFLPFMVILLNQSMFSSLLTGGGILLLSFFLMNSRSSIHVQA